MRRDDTGPNPDVAKRVAQELILRDKVQIVTGGQWTPNSMAAAALTKEAKIPFIPMAASGSARQPTGLPTRRSSPPGSHLLRHFRLGRHEGDL